MNPWMSIIRESRRFGNCLSAMLNINLPATCTKYLNAYTIHGYYSFHMITSIYRPYAPLNLSICMDTTHLNT